MENFDLTPLIRTSIGFDHLMRMMDSAMQTDSSSETYPPYNIEKHTDDDYRITMAVAGFGEEDITITLQDNSLVVTGKSSQNKSAVKYLHRGIAGRAFEKHFQLADFIKVGDANLENGLLSIDLKREIPEAMKPQAISINSKKSKAPLIEQG